MSADTPPARIDKSPDQTLTSTHRFSSVPTTPANALITQARTDIQSVTSASLRQRQPSAQQQ